MVKTTEFIDCTGELLPLPAEIERLRSALEEIAVDCEDLVRTWTPDHPEITKAEMRTWKALGKKARAALADAAEGE